MPPSLFKQENAAMTTNELSEAGKAEMEAGRAAKERSLREFAERTKGKPTPTQEENDEAAAGKSFVGIEHEADGSDVEQQPSGMTNRQLENKPGGGYTTRQTQARPAVTPKPPSAT